MMTSPHPPMPYDYYGFPPEAYQITWPAPGDPALAARVRGIRAQFPCNLNDPILAAEGNHLNGEATR